VLNFEGAEEARCKFEQERNRLQLLLAVNNAVVINLDPHELFGIIAKSLRRVMANDYTSLSLYDLGQSHFNFGVF